MIARIRLVLPVLLLLHLAGCASSVKVMTFNVRYASDQGPQRWPVRRPVLIALLERSRPDVIGTQELLQRQGDDIVSALPGYRWFGRDRAGGHADEHMGVFYRPDRVRLLRSGDFWLSDTPERPNSMSWGADLPRMATWAVFETRGSRPRQFLFVDTHLAHRDQDDAARERSAALILERLAAFPATLPVVLAGDMNTRPNSRAYAIFAQALRDARTHSRAVRGPENTFHDFTGTADRRIDYLFTRGFRATTVETDDYHQGGVYPSDHFPVTATFRFAAAGPKRP
ncbi:endonuclease/exonuclease/phosphatase family protein [Sphingomonas sp. S2-65]|uniref:endonuclease/exonuclease/phosphatase family protein n=1 Tax=Sphingomonas sp. S2-65 TaxID=2903960 RepID=UPI001F17B349|nr:endonuclease/exonuclease/phosphatase family protein [Sphingomonas sp. S2-65]UYY59086.1 endonuclease/exonuclease/phosphatase family protein [Sphingomonas sp. S2-65]